MDSGVASALSIRMEGGFEELVAFGPRYTESRHRFVSVTLEDVAAVRSRLDTMASEDAAFQRLLGSYERLAEIATDAERAAVAEAIEARELLLTGMRWLADDPSGELATSWAKGRDRLTLVARVRSACRTFRPSIPQTEDWHLISVVLLSAVGGLVGVVALCAVGLVFMLVAPVLVLLFGVPFDGLFRAPPPCSHCAVGADVDRFEDFPNLAAALRRETTGRPGCARCGLRVENFEAAMRAVPTAKHLPPRPAPARLPAAGYLR